MSLPILVLVGTGIIAVMLLVTLAAVVIGIHRGDRHLTSTPQSHTDAFARRVLTGIRLYGGSTNGDGQ